MNSSASESKRSRRSIPALALALLASAGVLAWLFALRSRADVSPRETRFAATGVAVSDGHARGPVVLEAPGVTSAAWLTSAPEPGPREVTAPRETPRESSVWTIAVRVIGDDGRPVQRATLDYCYGRFNVGTTRNLPGTRASVEVTSDITRLEIPRGTAEVRVTAIAADEVFGCTRVNVLERAKSGPPREIAVDVHVSSDYLSPALFGTLRCRDGRALPADLEVWLIPVVTDEERIAMPAESALASIDVDPTQATRRDPLAPRPGRNPIACVINRVEGTYRVGPLTPGFWHLRATSDAIAPKAFPLERVIAPVAERRMDLVLDDGLKLRLTAVYDDGLPAAGVEFRCAGNSIVWPGGITGRRGEAWSKTARAADTGVCEFAGLPEGDAVFVSRKTANDRDEPLVRIDATVSSPRVVEARVVVTRHESVLAWGPMPDAREYGDETLAAVKLRSCAADRRGTTNIYRQERLTPLPLGESRWSVQLPSIACAWDIWLERDGRRISTVASVPAGAPAEVGPLQLAPLPATDAVVNWFDAPPGWSLRMCSTSRDGQLGPLVEAQLGSGAGNARMLVADHVPVEVCLTRGAKTNVRFGAPTSVATSAEGLDLHGRHLAALVVRVNAAPATGTGEIAVARAGSLPGDVENYRAQVELVDGRSTTAVPLPPGSYAYRLDNAAYPGVVCGWFEVRAGDFERGEIIVDWKGVRIRPSELVGGAPDDVELVQCAGRELPATFAQRWSRFNLSTHRLTALQAGTGPPTVFAAPARYLLRAATSTH